MNISKWCFVFMLCIFTASANAQESDLSKAFDFWVGEWDLSWVNSDSSVSVGENIITRTHNKKVIEENFKALDGKLKGYEGSSWSVYNPQTNEWKQTWVDNQGGYLDFTGAFDGDRKIFQREATTPRGQTSQRMVFHSFTNDGFTWDWESSKDGGENWSLQWRIEYSKRK